jgi:UPF0042 nucleotide-binding protein
MAESRAEGGEPDRAPPLVIVTGLSGAGRTTAINALEDLGYEALNNFPLSLIGTLLAEARGRAQPIAIGIETRTRGFSAAALSEILTALRQRHGAQVLLLFLDCSDETLVRRFSETRRRHPLAPAEDAAAGVARERDLLRDILGAADMVIDTSGLTPHDLRREVEARFATRQGRGLTVSIGSFSYKRGVPTGSDVVIDVRFLRNPYWVEGLRHLDGRDPRVQDYVVADPRFGAFFDKLAELLLLLLPAYVAEGKVYFSVALGCTGGRHRSVTVAERLAARLGEAGWPALVRHRELGRGPEGRPGETGGTAGVSVCGPDGERR